MTTEIQRNATVGVCSFEELERDGHRVLIGTARFLTAHAPTVRAVGQTYEIAARLHWGEALHGEDE